MVATGVMIHVAAHTHTEAYQREFDEAHKHTHRHRYPGDRRRLRLLTHFQSLRQHFHIALNNLCALVSVSLVLSGDERFSEADAILLHTLTCVHIIFHIDMECTNSGGEPKRTHTKTTDANSWGTIFLSVRFGAVALDRNL